MRRDIRRLYGAATAVAITAGTIWLVLAVWRSPHRNDLATFWQFAAAVAVIAVGLIGRTTRPQPSQQAGSADPAELNHMADLLAEAVQNQWTRAADERGLLQPEPIPVRWQRSRLPLAGPASAAISSQRFPPLPGLTATSQQRLRAGTLRDLHAVYGGLGSGRLVIAGGPGAGKSGAAILLLLDALKFRATAPAPHRPLIPLPVMFTLAGWDPNTKRLANWLAARIAQTYPLFAGKHGTTAAAALLRNGRLAVLLDGLDEIPQELRPAALRALSEQATFRIVVLTRSAEMAATAQRGILTGAAAIELQDVKPPVAANYLTRVQRTPPPPGWHELISRMRSAPHSPLAEALSNPLALTLTRDTYRTADDARELIHFCDTTDPSPTRQDIEDHLLDRVLPTAYTQQPGLPPPRYNPQTAQHTLGRIAARMNQDKTRDLTWWRITKWASPAPGVIMTGLAIGLLGALLGGGLLGGGLLGALLGGLLGGLGSGVGVATGRGRPSQQLTPLRWRRLFNTPGLAAGIPAGVLLGPLIGFTRGPAIGLASGLGNCLIYMLAGALIQPRRDNTSPLSPPASWRSDWLAGLAAALATGLMAVLIFWLAWGLAFGLLTGLMFASWIGFTVTGTWAASVVFMQLAIRLRTPIHLMRFLDDARQHNVLRTVGPVYQFRHARLQDRLAHNVTAHGSKTDLRRKERSNGGPTQTRLTQRHKHAEPAESS